jgi:HKD family nuclease
MPRLAILNPNDQPLGKWRLLNHLRTCLEHKEFDSLRMTVAFAKTGPLARLATEIDRWLARKNTIEAVFGIDHQGTSKQALEFALEKFTTTWVLHVGPRATFHPKMYFFTGPRLARLFIGSHNLTVGGTEVNWESGVVIDIDRPQDERTLEQANDVWKSLVSSSAKLDKSNLVAYEAAGLLLDETKQQRRRSAPYVTRASRGGTTAAKFVVVPPSPLPSASVARAQRGSVGGARQQRPLALPLAAEALIIQIVPHDNGEVFLSKRAADQNPDFFGFPFSGRTTPKKPTNPAYPQREPDPIVNLIVYDSAGAVIVRLPRLALNTVYYESKSEIRITVPPEVVRAVPHYSILVMRQSPQGSNYDYDMEIFPPNNPQFDSYLLVCNQTLPSGGKAQPRRMGWL